MNALFYFAQLNQTPTPLQPYIRSANADPNVSMQYFKNTPSTYEIANCNTVTTSFCHIPIGPGNLSATYRSPSFFWSSYMQVLIPVHTGHGWSCYAVDTSINRLTVLDPMLIGGGNSERMKWHEDTSRKVLQESVGCMEVICNNLTPMNSKWQVNIQVADEPKCNR